MTEVMKVRDANGRFVPGVSGNPQGRPGLDPEVKAILSAAAPDAARKLVELSQSDDERVATVAAQAILDRLFGKPATATDLKVQGMDSAALHHATLLALAAQAVPVEQDTSGD